MLSLVGLQGGLLAFFADIPYIIDTARGKTQPHRVTWGIFFLLNLIFLANQLAAGATSSIWLVVGYTLATFIIFMMSLKRGVGGTTKLDIVVIVGALIGVVVWQLLDSPLASIVANLVVAAIAGIPTYRKAWHDPESETKISFGLGSLAALMSAISVGKPDLILLLLPVYSFIYQGSIYLILIRPHHAKSA